MLVCDWCVRMSRVPYEGAIGVGSVGVRWLLCWCAVVRRWRRPRKETPLKNSQTVPLVPEKPLKMIIKRMGLIRSYRCPFCLLCTSNTCRIWNTVLLRVNKGKLCAVYICNAWLLLAWWLRPYKSPHEYHIGGFFSLEFGVFTSYIIGGFLTNNCRLQCQK